MLVLLRHPFQHLISPGILINVLGVAAVLTGSLRRSERSRSSDGRGGAGPSEVWPSAPSRSSSVPCCLARGQNERALAIVFAAWGLVGGSLLLIEGFRLRSLAHRGSLEDVLEPRSDG